MYVVLMYFALLFWIDTYYDGSGRMTYFMEDKCMEWRQEKDMPVFMYIFLINRGCRGSKMDRERKK